MDKQTRQVQKRTYEVSRIWADRWPGLDLGTCNLAAYVSDGIYILPCGSMVSDPVDDCSCRICNHVRKRNGMPAAQHSRTARTPADLHLELANRVFDLLVEEHKLGPAQVLGVLHGILWVIFHNLKPNADGTPNVDGFHQHVKLFAKRAEGMRDEYLAATLGKQSRAE